VVKALVTIGVGYDGSTDSVAALRWAARLANQCQARLTVLHAVGLLEHAGLIAAGVPHQADVLEIGLNEGLDQRQFEWRVVDGDPCSALLRLTDSPAPVDLIVVGSRGSGQHAGSLLGSTSLELVEHSNVPVVVVPSRSPS
jgi:nucleotide-binding universal stress UspA family protein